MLEDSHRKSYQKMFLVEDSYNDSEDSDIIMQMMNMDKYVNGTKPAPVQMTNTVFGKAETKNESESEFAQLSSLSDFISNNKQKSEKSSKKR